MLIERNLCKKDLKFSSFNCNILQGKKLILRKTHIFQLEIIQLLNHIKIMNKKLCY